MGDICGGIVMGTKLAIYGMETLGMTPGEKDKRLIVFTEIDYSMYIGCYFFCNQNFFG